MIKLAWPSCMLICGPSMAGKSQFTIRLLQERAQIYEQEPRVIIFCYNEYQPSYETFAHWPNVHMIEGLPDLQNLKKFKDLTPLLVIDDLMTALDKSPDAEKLFSVACHHYNMSVIAIIHSLFYSKVIRNLRLNSSYLCLFKNNNDRLTIRNLASQLMPSARNFFISSYEDCTKEPHSYMFIDLHKTTPEQFRLRTSIFPGETVFCYVPK